MFSSHWQSHKRFSFNRTDVLNVDGFNWIELSKLCKKFIEFCANEIRHESFACEIKVERRLSRENSFEIESTEETSIVSIFSFNVDRNRLEQYFQAQRMSIEQNLLVFIIDQIVVFEENLSINGRWEKAKRISLVKEEFSRRFEVDRKTEIELGLEFDERKNSDRSSTWKRNENENFLFFSRRRICRFQFNVKRTNFSTKFSPNSFSVPVFCFHRRKRFLRREPISFLGVNVKSQVVSVISHLIKRFLNNRKEINSRNSHFQKQIQSINELYKKLNESIQQVFIEQLKTIRASDLNRNEIDALRDQYQLLLKQIQWNPSNIFLSALFRFVFFRLKRCQLIRSIYPIEVVEDLQRKKSHRNFLSRRKIFIEKFPFRLENEEKQEEYKEKIRRLRNLEKIMNNEGPHYQQLVKHYYDLCDQLSQAENALKRLRNQQNL